MKFTEYTVSNGNFGRNITFAVISDLHGNSPEAPLKLLEKARPDYILAPGDIFEPMNGTHKEINEAGFALLSGASKIAPTFFSPGNHEVGGIGSWRPGWTPQSSKEKYSAEELQKLYQTGVHFLDDSYKIYDGIAFGGLASGLIRPDRKPECTWLDGFFAQKLPKVLLCHHPEYYEEYIKSSDTDLIVSGHAHGGQWRIFGRGVFAPGQGLFPKYTSGVHDNRFVISTGLKKGIPIPRFFNPPEVVAIRVICTSPQKGERS